MKVVVIFDYPEITDLEGEGATFMIDNLSEDLLDFGDDTGHVWYIDDVYTDAEKE